MRYENGSTAMSRSLSHPKQSVWPAEDQRQAQSVSDVVLVARTRAGDKEAFSGLIHRYHGSLVRIAQQYVSTRASADEVAQDAWMGVLEGLAHFQERSSFRTWLFTILINRAKTRGVREGRSVPLSALGSDDPGSEPAVAPERFNQAGRWSTPPRPWAVETPEDLVSRREAMQVLARAVEELPANYRLILTLRDIEGMDGEEVCHVLQISESNQRVLLHRARARVRRALEAHFGGAP